jgi:hypothetical protein
MKSTFFKIAMVAWGLFCCSLFPEWVQAQEKQEGYWVVETNLLTRDYTLIRFYTDQHQLLYEEKLAGYSLDITKTKNKKRLNKALKQLTEKSLVSVTLVRSQR